VALLGLVARSAAASPSLTITEALARAESGAPDVVLSVSRAATARTEIGVAGMLQNPRVTVGTTTGSAAVFASLFVALPLFGQRGVAMGAAEAQARVATAGVELARLDARLAVTFAWVALWQAQAELGIARDNATRRDRILEIAKIRYTEGAAPRLEILRVETEARRAHGEVSAQEAQQTAAAARLAALVSDPRPSSGGERLPSGGERLPSGGERLPSGGTPLPSAAGEPRTRDGAPSDAELEAALVEHPLLRRARALLRSTEAVVARERRDRWPVLGLQIGGAFADRNPPPNNDFNFALSADLPLFNGALVNRALGARDTARVELDAVTVQARARALAARADHLAALRRRAALVDSVLPSASEVAELSAEAYRAGGLDLTGTLAAEQSLSDVKLAAVRATADSSRALGLLEHAAGRSW